MKIKITPRKRTAIAVAAVTVVFVLCAFYGWRIGRDYSRQIISTYDKTTQQVTDYANRLRDVIYKNLPPIDKQRFANYKDN